MFHFDFYVSFLLNFFVNLMFLLVPVMPYFQCSETKVPIAIIHEMTYVSNCQGFTNFM